MRRPALLLLAAFGVLAVAMAIAAPPFIGADELYHWQRAVQVSGGGLLSRYLGPNSWGGAISVRSFDLQIAYFLKYTNHLPLSASEMARTVQAIMAKPAGQTIVAPFPSTAAFSPLAYIPQALGILVGWVAQLDIQQQSYAGRLANVAAYFGLLAAIVRVLPWGAVAVVLVACIPGVLQVNSTLSADPLNLALPLLLTALVLRARSDGRPLRQGLRWGVFGLSVSMALLKPTLVVIVPIVFLLPAAGFRSRRQGWAFKAGCVIAAAAVGAAWNAAYPFVPGRHWGIAADPAAAIAQFRADPSMLVALIGRSLDAFAGLWWHDAYGKFAGHAAPYYFHSGIDWLDWAGLAGIVATAILFDPPARRDPVAALWLIGLAAGYSALILTAFAVGYNKPGAAVILGVQGRYFMIPFAFLALALSAARLAPWAPRRAGQAGVAAAALTGLGLSGYGVVRLAQYWGP